MNKVLSKKLIILSGTFITLFSLFNLMSNAIKYRVHEETTVVAGSVQEFGNSWYVDKILLQKTFKSGMRDPKTGDSINLKLDEKGRVVGWKVKR